MSGLGNSHTHFTWNDGTLDVLDDVPVEEHRLATFQAQMLR